MLKHGGVLIQPDNQSRRSADPSAGEKQYIAEVDTWRAIAVLVVLAFHGFPAIVPGGFIGVDIFFVISGFVISRSYLYPVILRQKTLAQFYQARFRRLTPALIVMLTATSMAAGALLYPNDLIRYGKALLAQPVYLQNVIFWLEGDYFNRALTKPLLHTWSLAVEEQFYALFGIALLILCRRPKWLAPALITIILISYAVMFPVASVSPKTAFYMLPFRMWQFGLGILAFTHGRMLKRIAPAVARIIVLTCAALTVASALFFAEEGRHTALQAALASLSTGLGLAILGRGDIKVPALTTPVGRYIGNISYPLYLWHWPILSIWSTYVNRTLTRGEVCIALVSATILAALTYHFVEEPVRRQRIIVGTRTLVRACVIAFAVVAVSGVLLCASNGLLHRYPPEIQAYFAAAQESNTYRCGIEFRIHHPGAEICPTSDPVKSGASLLLIGDSHADLVEKHLTAMASAGGVRVHLAVQNCKIGTFGAKRNCPKALLRKMISEAKAAGIRDIVGIAFWEDGNFNQQRLQQDAELLIENGFNLWLMETVPTDPGYDPALRAKEALVKNRALDREGITTLVYEARIGKQRAAFDALQVRYPESVHVLRPQQYLCHDGRCAYQNRGYPYYHDSNHLTGAGIDRVKPLLEQLLKSISRS